MRYTFVRGVTSLSWLAATALFAVLIVALLPVGAPFGGTMGGGGLGILALSTWLGLTAINDEDPSHQSVLATAAGGRLRARLGQVVAAYLMSIVLGLLVIVAAEFKSIGFPAEVGPSIRAAASAGGIAALAFAGVCIAYCCGWPVLQRRAVSSSIGLVTVVLAIGLPWSPLRAIASTLSALDKVAPDFTFLASCVLAVAISVALAAISSFVIRIRWRVTT